MSTNQVDVHAPPERVFDALLDARTYPYWLVGTKRIRHVEHDWPSDGSSFHHTVGVGPLSVHDRTTIVGVDRPRSIELDAGIGPFGAARVRFEVRPTADGCRVEVDEVPSRGLVRVVWNWAGKLLMQASLFSRNLVSLEKFCTYVEEGHHAEPDEAAGHGADDPEPRDPDDESRPTQP